MTKQLQCLFPNDILYFKNNTKNKVRSIALYFGSFDPFHFGHKETLDMAEM